MSKAGDIWMAAYAASGGEDPADLALTQAIMAGTVEPPNLKDLADELWDRRWKLKESGWQPPKLRIVTDVL